MKKEQNNQNDQLKNPSRRKFIEMASAVVFVTATDPWSLFIPTIGVAEAPIPERPRTWETFPEDISNGSNLYGIDLPTNNVDVVGLGGFTQEERETFRKLHLISQERTAQAFNEVVTDKNKGLIPFIFLTPQIRLTLTRDESRTDGATTLIRKNDENEYSIESYYGVELARRLFMIANEQAHHTSGGGTFRYRHPQIGSATYEAVSNCASFDTAFNIQSARPDIQIKYPFDQLWESWRETTTRGFVPYERNTDYLALVSIMEPLMIKYGRDPVLVTLRESVGFDITNHILGTLQASELRREMILLSMNMLDQSIPSKIKPILDHMIQRGFVPDDTTDVAISEQGLTRVLDLHADPEQDPELEIASSLPTDIPIGIMQIAAFHHFQKPEDLHGLNGEPGRLIAMVSIDNTGTEFMVAHPEEIVSAQILGSDASVDISQIYSVAIKGSAHPAYFMPLSVADLEEGQIMEFKVRMVNGVIKTHNLVWRFLGESPEDIMQTSGQTAANRMEELLSQHPEVANTSSSRTSPLEIDLEKTLEIQHS